MQRAVTAIIIHKLWNGQTYDYFEDMITEIKCAGGTCMYDYTVFGCWVEFIEQHASNVHLVTASNVHSVTL